MTAGNQSATVDEFGISPKSPKTPKSPTCPEKGFELFCSKAAVCGYPEHRQLLIDLST